MPTKVFTRLSRFGLLCIGLFVVANPALAQGLATFDRDNAETMLNAVKDDLKGTITIQPFEE